MRRVEADGGLALGRPRARALEGVAAVRFGLLVARHSLMPPIRALDGVEQILLAPVSHPKQILPKSWL